ncbi:MAG TPA: PD-(D/E)XK nuclease family protein, partial [Polyangiaceae bacterium]
MVGIGLHELTPEEYHGDPCEVPALSSSIAKILVTESPAHAWLAHPRLGGRRFEPSADMDRGSLMHALLLQHERPVSVVDADDWRTKAAREAREAARAAGVLPVLRHKYDSALKASEVIRSRLRDEWGILLDGRVEVAAVWEELADDGTKVLCRAQMDHLAIDLGAASILDLKCGGCAAPDFCERQMVPMGYDIQQAAYTRAIESIFPRLAG